MNKKVISLNDEQLDHLADMMKTESVSHFDSCLCGYYEMYLKNVGYITMNVYCERSQKCPEGMSWNVEDKATIWEESVVVNYDYIPTEEEANNDGITKLIGYLDEVSVEKVKQLIRKDIIENYSYNYCDEYDNVGITNWDNIRSMCDEELAEWLSKYKHNNDTLNWLNQLV